MKKKLDHADKLIIELRKYMDDEIKRYFETKKYKRVKKSEFEKYPLMYTIYKYIELESAKNQQVIDDYIYKMLNTKGGKQ